METEEIERAEAREYALRGLRTVALAGLVAIGSTPSLVGGPFVEHAWLPFGLFALLVLAAYRAECYYNDRYGYLAVPDPPRRVVVRRIVVCALPALVLGVAVRLTDLPVNLMAIVGAVILLALFTDLVGFERLTWSSSARSSPSERSRSGPASTPTNGASHSPRRPWRSAASWTTGFSSARTAAPPTRAPPRSALALGRPERDRIAPTSWHGGARFAAQTS
jgi:hypothetical protein